MIVPCYNSAAHLRELLESLLRQSFSGVWELIIVSRGSNDDTVSIAGEYAQTLPNFRLIAAEDNRGVSFSRNEGADLANSENLIFIDSDDVVNERYLEAMLEALRHGSFVCSKIDYARLNPTWVVEAFGRELEGGANHPILPYANGGNIGIKHSVHRALGGFDPGLNAFEDIDYSWRAQALGYELTPVTDAVVHYRVKPQLTALHRKGYRDALPNARVLKKNFPGYVPPWMCLAGLGARLVLTVLGLALVRGQGSLARWVLNAAYLRGDFVGCLREGYLALLPRGSPPQRRGRAAARPYPP